MNAKIETSLAEAAASELIRQHSSREPFRALHGDWALDEAQAAYQVQDAYVARLVRQRNTSTCGHKIALTTPAMRQMVGFHDSISGFLFSDQILSSGQSVQASRYGRLLVEFEIALRIARDVPHIGKAWDRRGIFDYVACAYPAIEVADDRNADYALLAESILTLAADNAWNQGLVLGEAIAGADPDSLLRVEGIATVDGREIGRGTGKDVLGHPLDALAWLASHLEQRGIVLKQGALVTTGSLVRSHFPVAGSEVRFELLGMGDVALRVA